jgi:hypothetical protein
MRVYVSARTFPVRFSKNVTRFPRGLAAASMGIALPAVVFAQKMRAPHDLQAA